MEQLLASHEMAIYSVHFLVLKIIDPFVCCVRDISDLLLFFVFLQHGFRVPDVCWEQTQSQRLTECCKKYKGSLRGILGMCADIRNLVCCKLDSCDCYSTKTHSFDFSSFFFFFPL